MSRFSYFIHVHISFHTHTQTINEKSVYLPFDAASVGLDFLTSLLIGNSSFLS